jgi:hypothetical protein
VKGNKRYADLDADVKNALLFLEKRFLTEKNIIEGNKKHLAAPLPAIAKDIQIVEGKLDFWMEHLERQYQGVQEVGVKRFLNFFFFIVYFVFCL